MAQLDSLHYCNMADALSFRDCKSFWNWNGYIATWTIDDGKLYLTSISTFDYKHNYYDPKNYLTDFVDKSGRVFASWFSGELECEKGDVLWLSDDGLHDICESTIKISVKYGVVVSSQEYANRKHVGKNQLSDFDLKAIRAYLVDKFSEFNVVLVFPSPLKIGSDGTIRQWDFKIHPKNDLSPKDREKLLRELSEIFLKYDFDTYFHCGEWIIRPESSFSVFLGKLPNFS